jgi:DNA-3-methyladenine glycosylase II
MTELTGELPAVAPFDLRTSIRVLRGFGACKGDQLLTDDTLTKAIAVDGRAVVFRLTSAGDGGVAYRLRADGPIGPQLHERLRRTIAEYLSLSDDLGDFYRLAAGDVPPYAELVHRLTGLHHVRFLTVAEIGVWAVLSQRTPQTVASALKNRVTRELGPALTVDGTEFRAFPEQATLAGLGVEGWLRLTGMERKAERIAALFEGLTELGEDYLRQAPYAEASAALRRIHGVGEFTAAAILLRGLGRMDAVPLTMPAFRNATARIYGPGVHDGRLRQRYGAQLGYWAYYLRNGLAAAG